MKDAMMQSLKSLAQWKNIQMYELARVIGIYPSTLSVWFRTYNKDHYEKIMQAIQQIEGGVQNDEAH